MTRALSTTITPPHIHDSALGLPSQLLGQLSNQVSRLFLRPPWSIVPSPRLVCGPQLWLNDVISDPKAGRVSRRKHGAGGGGAPTGDNEPGEVMPIFLMISALLTGNEKKKACFPNPRFHVCRFFSASGGLSTRRLRNKQKKNSFLFLYLCLYSSGIGQYYCHNQYSLSKDWLLGWCVYLLQWGHCKAIIFTKSFL